MNFLRAFLFGLLFLVAFQALASTGDVAHGKTLSETCTLCHGLDGNSMVAVTPNLAGQHASYILQSLVEFKKGPTGLRNNPLMMGFVIPLSDQDMVDLAAYYETLTPAVGMAQANLVERGAKIYRGGILADKVPACTGCHGPKGEGIDSAKFPRIAGQNADYTVAQLVAFRKGERKSPNGIMEGVAKHMTPDDMAAVASYIQGLH